MAKIHPWESSGLGTAPFQFFRFERHETKVATCDVCGQRIKNVFWVNDAKGNIFRAGSECIQKVEPDWSPLRKDADNAIKKAREEDNALRVTAVWALIKNDPDLLSDAPSPYRTDKSLREWATFALENGGPAKRLEVCRVVEAYVAKRPSN